MDETINWDTPIPIDAAPDVPRFPIDALPGHIWNYVHALAEETQVPVEAVASVVLGTMAACVAGKAVINPRGSWEEPLCLYTVTAMDPGNRKSAVFKLATKPLKDVEVELQQAMAPVIASAIDLKEFKESAAKRAKNGKNADEYLQLAQAAREVIVGDFVENARQGVADLQAQDVDAIILLTQISRVNTIAVMEEVPEFAAALREENGASIPTEIHQTSDGRYIVGPDADYGAVIHLDITVDRASGETTVEPEVIKLDENAEEDSVWAARSDAYYSDLDDMLGGVIAHTDVDL